jgi:DNA polymerase V
MAGAHIHHGDLVVVERHRSARPGQVVVALLADGFTLKYLVRERGRWRLRSAHPAYPCLELAEGQLWGVATHVIRRLAPGGA